MNWLIYCNNSPLVFVDPTGLDVRLLTDTASVGTFGHTAVMVAVYDEEGAIVGYNIYEVGPKRKLVNDYIDDFQGEGTDQEVLSVSQYIVYVAVVREYYPANSDELARRIARYNLVTKFNTTQSEDAAIDQHAIETGKKFGNYDILTNTCADHAVGSLAPANINTSRRAIYPWQAHLQLMEENPERVLEHFYFSKTTTPKGGNVVGNNPLNQAALIN